ncbi:MAG: hypothetical protein HC888_03070 [Candidatus Competibacteraceae bacterium]|nr:hypothetical protein [Candidatus Competibacteraceae bacterium]
MMLRKVISGGQTGVDIAGLRAAKLCGLETGGTAPKGYRTMDGVNYDLRDIFGVAEHADWAYPPRTECNVKDSDATIRVATNFDSTGERLTHKYLCKHRRPYFDVDPRNPPDVAEVVEWLRDNRVEILNVAGNSERTSPGIEVVARDFLFKVFRRIRDDRRL